MNEYIDLGLTTNSHGRLMNDMQCGRHPPFLASKFHLQSQVPGHKLKPLGLGGWEKPNPFLTA